ncbi:MAG: RibD family protein, partial [Pseudoruegeria sp.]
NRPLVSLKLANSFDGRIATATGESQWITGAGARRLVHAQRASHDAVMVGAGTARADDPSLTVRGMGMTHQPVRVVCSRRLDLPFDSQLARTAKDIPVWLMHGQEADLGLIAAWQGFGAICIEVPTAPNRELQPQGILAALAARGLTRVFCEGGGSLAASLLSADVVDQLIGFTAGLALGAEGRPSIGAMGVARLAQAPRFALDDVRAVDGDILHFWKRAG